MSAPARAQLPAGAADTFRHGGSAQAEEEAQALPHGQAFAFDELGPGEVQRRMLALDAGEWRLRCTIPTHAERGMIATLTVSG